ncbi:RING finger protein 141-like [Brachionus plicatilis]|uniref:RING finger protein 141 n=1 Tax=Brachionus plicatilis TaxID=10195 RepID=A0A3M7R459_BRAPC|nr:RING finger protein 141-like [Brachionus plicatilis]
MDTSIEIKKAISKLHLADMFHLKYPKFIEMIEELNSIAEYFLDENGNALDFKIAKGTDLTFFWKFTIRIECTKSKIGDSDIKSFRLLKLNEFLHIYQHIKQYADALKLFDDTQQNNLDSVQPKLTSSFLFDNIQVLNQSSSLNEDICCICMEEKTNLVLSCSHNYCEKCIEEWKITSKTCPICRCIMKDNDSFIIAEKPNFFHIQEEIFNSLFQITDHPMNQLREGASN